MILINLILEEFYINIILEDYVIHILYFYLLKQAHTKSWKRKIRDRFTIFI